MNFFKQKFIQIIQTEQGCSWTYDNHHSPLFQIPIFSGEDNGAKAEKIVDSYQDCYRLFGIFYSNRYNTVTSLCLYNGSYEDCQSTTSKIKKSKGYNNWLSLTIEPGFSLIFNDKPIFFSKAR